ncbi:MAG: HD domain-containing protein [Methanoregula sp.]|uniref:HD domain-containing protein n=1 Tax=Methanoregula sp. TaxID=2052170 RepID=UPI003FD8750D
MSPTTQQPQHLEFQQTIFDNVHGFIPLTAIEYRIIGTQEFQRLRNIRQLGLLDYIFPGALHTRFNHSLGVLYVVDKMVKSLQRKGYLLDNQDNRQIIRLIGLLHDIGHYPWSHVTESVVIGDLKKKIRSLPQREDKIVLTSGTQIVTDSRGSRGNDLITQLENSESHAINKTFNESRNDSLDFAHHERLASIVIEKTEIKDILMDSFSPDQIKKISQVIAGTTPCLEKALIHSELDADRFDYLLRDSKQTGVTYGLFDLDQIIRNLDFSFDAPEGSTGLFIRKKGAKAVEDYLLARYFLYSTVIYQKASIGFQKMAHIIYEGLLERGEIASYCDIIRYFDTNDLESFYNFNDLTLLQKIRSVAKNDNLVDSDQYTYNADLIKGCCEKIIKRKPLKLVVEKQRILNKNEPELSLDFDLCLTNPTVIDEIVESANIEKYWCIPSEVSTSVTNISPLIPISPRDKGESILIEGENNIPKFLINDESLIIKQLANSSLKIDAIYTKNDEYKDKILAAIEKCRMIREMWNRPSI